MKNFSITSDKSLILCSKCFGVHQV